MVARFFRPTAAAIEAMLAVTGWLQLHKKI